MSLSFLQKQITKYSEEHGRSHLPWRKAGIGAYEVWVSEVMLQQTQVNRVIGYFTRFLERFPTVIDLSQATWEEFLPYYSGLGYYRRGQNMLKTAKVIVEDFGGAFPRDKKVLMSLPGIGEYTASAILTFAYGENHLAYDTNLQKVFGRYLYGNKRAEVDRDILEEKLGGHKGELSSALMDFANDVCLRTPKCDGCPLKKHCEYTKTSGRKEIQPKKIRKSFPVKDAQVFLWLHKDHTEYYSENLDLFQVFRLSKEVNTREGIKEYFREKYDLELAVRPPHKKEYVDGKPTLFVNAQILLGEHEFGVFSKEEIGSVSL